MRTAPVLWKRMLDRINTISTGGIFFRSFNIRLGHPYACLRHHRARVKVPINYSAAAHGHRSRRGWLELPIRRAAESLGGFAQLLNVLPLLLFAPLPVAFCRSVGCTSCRYARFLWLCTGTYYMGTTILRSPFHLFANCLPLSWLLASGSWSGEEESAKTFSILNLLEILRNRSKAWIGSPYERQRKRW